MDFSLRESSKFPWIQVYMNNFEVWNATRRWRHIESKVYHLVVGSGGKENRIVASLSSI